MYAGRTFAKMRAEHAEQLRQFETIRDMSVDDMRARFATMDADAMRRVLTRHFCGIGTAAAELAAHLDLRTQCMREQREREEAFIESQAGHVNIYDLQCVQQLIMSGERVRMSNVIHTPAYCVSGGGGYKSMARGEYVKALNISRRAGMTSCDFQFELEGTNGRIWQTRCENIDREAFIRSAWKRAHRASEILAADARFPASVANIVQDYLIREYRDDKS
jgi:hypothetical protein